jgi:glycosyltransferase involved in cell wall biosynthesis
MRISIGTRIDLDKLDVKNGYGYATQMMIESLERLGYHVQENDSTADVEIWFDQPHWWKFSKGPYKIGYHPWESTALLPGWKQKMNATDEIWTPSPLIANWYRDLMGITVPIHVYEHGIDHIWTPKKREPEEIKFLHVGAEASRKGGWDVVTCFRKAFPQRAGKRLTLKMIKSGWNGVPELGGIRYVNKKMDFPELQDLFYTHDVYVYPSWGEGFGLTPLQAMATGMPTITLPGWAPYRQFMDPDLAVGHTMEKSKWPQIHPGQMMKPNLDDVVDRMRYVVDNYDVCSDYAYYQAENIHRAYDWDTITAKVFGDLEHRIFDRDFDKSTSVKLVGNPKISARIEK